MFSSELAAFTTQRRKEGEKQAKGSWCIFLMCFTSYTVPPDDPRELNLNQAPVDTALHYSTSAYS